MSRYTLFAYGRRRAGSDVRVLEPLQEPVFSPPRRTIAEFMAEPPAERPRFRSHDEEIRHLLGTLSAYGVAR